MAGETRSESSDDDEEIRKRKKRLEGILGAPRSEQPTEKAPPPLDLALGKVAAETNKETKKPKPAPRAETDPADPDETELTADEQVAAERQIINARREAVADELNDADPTVLPEIEANAEYLDRVDQRIQDGELPQDAIEAEYAAAAGLSDEAPTYDGEFGEDGAEGEVDLHAREVDNPPAAEDASIASAQAGERTKQANDSVEAKPQLGDANTFTAESVLPLAAHAAGEVSAAAAGVVAVVAAALVAARLGRRQVPERRVRAMQRSFERQVSQLHEQLIVHEEQVRRLARERNEAVQAVCEAQPSPAAMKIEQKPARPEIIHANTPPPDVERLALSDVLDISERIHVGNQTIRTIYEGNRISQRGLRRIVAEYLHGGNVRRVLKQELLIKAIGPELDPLLRDQVPESMATPPKSTMASGDGAREVPVLPSSTPRAPEQPTQPASSAARPTIASPGLIIANIIALVILGLLIAVLFVIWLIR